MNCPKKGLTFDEFIVKVPDLSDELQDAYLLAKAAGISWASYAEKAQMTHKQVFDLYKQFEIFMNDERIFWLRYGDRMNIEGSRNFLDYVR